MKRSIDTGDTFKKCKQLGDSTTNMRTRVLLRANNTSIFRILSILRTVLNVATEMCSKFLKSFI